MTEPTPIRERRHYKRCSLCDRERDDRGRLATVPTLGGWVAHEECVAAVPSVDARPQTGCQETP